jgi:hypothetical protein
VTRLSSVAAAGAPPGGPLTKCPGDAVVSGTVCMDRYEASVWRVPNPTTVNAALVAKIQQGKAKRADLVAGGATQLGTASDDYAPRAISGQSCANDIYAVSLAGVLPSRFVTWFQAQAACLGNRLTGPLEVVGTFSPSESSKFVGFRCARWSGALRHRRNRPAHARVVPRATRA